MYQHDQFECAVFYGRRRMGKTTLIDHCYKDKKTFYFTATANIGSVRSPKR